MESDETLDVSADDLSDELPSAIDQRAQQMANEHILDISADDLPEPLPPAGEQRPGRWYLYVDGTVHGPYAQEDVYHWVQHGNLSWDTLASRGRAETWRPIREIEEFYDPKHPYGGSPPPPPDWVGGGQVGPRRVQPGMVQPSTLPKSPALACVLNILLWGVGYIYLGQVTKGIVLMLVCWTVGWFFFLVTFGLASLVLIVVTAIDAYKIGQKLERGEAVGEWEFFPA